MLPKLTVGQWYIVVTCDGCKCKILLFHDLNEGRSKLRGSFVVICPTCQREASLAVEHYQHCETGKPTFAVKPLAAFCTEVVHSPLAG